MNTAGEPLRPEGGSSAPTLPALSREWVQNALFLTFFFACVLLTLDSRLLYHWHLPKSGLLFSATPEFARALLLKPGGASDFIDRLVAQGYALRWLGAGLMTAHAAVMIALTQVLLAFSVGRRIPFARFVPALLLLAWWGRYYDRPPSSSMIIGMALAALFAGFLARRPRSLALIGAFALLLGLAYFLGGSAGLFFAPAACFSWISRGPRRLIGLLWLAATAALVAAAAQGGHPSPGSVMKWLRPGSLPITGIHWALLLAVPLLGSAAMLVGRVLSRRSREAGVAIAGARRRRVVALAVALSPLLAAGLVAAWGFQHGGAARRWLTIDYHLLRGRWNDVLAAAATLPADEIDEIVVFQINCALQQANGLPDAMFAYPQFEGLPPSHSVDSNLELRFMADFYLRLGRVNDAEHYSYEMLALWGPEPLTLSRLATIHLVKGQTEAARRVLLYLSRDLVWGGRARQMLARMEKNPSVDDDATIAALRRRMLRRDDVNRLFTAASFDAWHEQMLLDALDQDPSNQQAFEFLMARYLCLPDLVKAARLMPLVRNLTGPAYRNPDGGRRVPLAYEEAMLLAGHTDPRTVPGIRIGFDTMRRRQILESLLAGGQRTIPRELWGSYFGFLAEREGLRWE